MSATNSKIYVDHPTMLYNGGIDRHYIRMTCWLTRAVGGVENFEIQYEYDGTQSELMRNAAIRDAIVAKINTEQNNEVFDTEDVFFGIALTQ